MKKSIEISPNLVTLFGTRDENLHVLEDGLNINIDLRSDRIELEGAPRDVARAEQLFADYDHLHRTGFQFQNGDLNSMLRVLVGDPNVTLRGLAEAGRQRSFGRKTVQPKSPNLRPLYDALFDMMDPEKVDRYLEKNVIEIAPIAFMRGRTLNDSFVIMDEAQNTTSEQMKMFVTRLGFNSKAVITGDITQIDLPNARRSGLVEAVDILKPVEGLAFVYFDESDVVRHHLVQRIIRAYDDHKTRVAEQQMLLSLEAKAAEVRSAEAKSTEAKSGERNPIAEGAIADGAASSSSPAPSQERIVL